jgi:hypothetical protein
MKQAAVSKFEKVLLESTPLPLEIIRWCITPYLAIYEKRWHNKFKECLWDIHASRCFRQVKLHPVVAWKAVTYKKSLWKVEKDTIDRFRLNKEVTGRFYYGRFANELNN